MNKTIKEFIPSINRSLNDFFRSPKPLYLGALFFLIMGATFVLQIPPNDYWWYVRLGQDILQNLTIPSVDSYTFTQTGKPYIYNAWLSGVLFWLLQEPTLATLLHGLLPVIFCGIIWHCCRVVGAGTRLATILTLMLVLICAPQFAMRPQLFSYPLFAFALLSLLQWQRGNTQWLWFLPFISLVWVNLHGAFALLFLLAGAALIGGEGDRKTLAIVLLTSFFTSLINPYGFFAWYNIYSVLANAPTQQLGTEWFPPTIAQNWHYKLLFLWILVFPIITSLSSSKLTLTHWLWYLGFAWMALNGLRYIVWLMAVLVPLNAILLTPLANRTIDQSATLGKPVVNLVIFIVFLSLPLAFLPEVRGHWMFNPRPVYTTNTPIAAVQWLKLHPALPGNLWADLAMSVYLIQALPDRPVWIGTRFNLYPIEQWQEYFTIAKALGNWENLLASYSIKLLLLDPDQQPLLIEALKKSNHWHSPYQDGHSVIFVLSKKQNNT